MFKYYGNIRTPRAPYMDENTKNHEEANVNKWWEALTKYADKEIEISRDLNKYPDTLFFLNDKGKMTPAIGKNEDMNSPAVRERLLNQARNNRLFISALDDIRPRQIITDDKYRVSFTKPIDDDLPEPKEQLPEKPRRPFFLKYLVRFAFKEEFKAYDEKKKIYDKAVKRRELIEKFRSDDNQQIFEKAQERDRKDESLRSRIEMKDAAELKKINEEISQKEEQRRREKEKELEEEKLRSVIFDGEEKAREEQRKMKDLGDINLDNSMKMGMIGLGHKDFAKETEYESYEALLSSFDTGEHLKEIWKVRRQGEAFQKIRDESGERPSRFAQALAHVIKVNNEKINNYTPNQPQFQLIAEINKSILRYNEHLSTPTLKEDLNTLGVTQEDWLTVRGVIETAKIYKYGVSAREYANSNLNYSSKYFKEDVSKIMAGEQVYVAVASHKVKCQSQDGPAPVNPLFPKLGKAAQNTNADPDGFKFFKKIAQGFENLKGFQKLCDSAKSNIEKAELVNDITRLRKEAVNFMTAELEAKLGMDYQVQAVKEVQKDNLEKNINEPKIEAPEIKAPKIEEGGLVI